MAEPPPVPEGEEERLGCLDLMAAVAGMGCAILVRVLILGAALIILYLIFHLLGWV